MKGNTFGRFFRITTWGESHGPSMGAVIDGCPAGIALVAEDFHGDMAMRRGGQANFATPRAEADEVLIESGVFAGLTTGTPICLRVVNQNTRYQDYEKYQDVPRPGHADFTTMAKHGHRDHRGGGRSSARETVARVAAAVVAKKLLATRGIELLGFVRSIGPLSVSETELPFHGAPTEKIIGELWERVAVLRAESVVRIPLADDSKFRELAERARLDGDSWGGSVECWVRGLPKGLGEPIFDKLNAVLSHALMSLPAAVGIEAGGGLRMASLPGSAIRDPIVATEKGQRVGGNNHGGLLGGMTTGEPLCLRVFFHAPTSIPQAIASTNQKTGEAVALSVEGRHDSVPLPRAVPMVEAMAALALADALLASAAIYEN